MNEAINNAIKLAKMGRLEDARQELSIDTGKIEKEDLYDKIQNLDKGINLIKEGNVLEATPYLQNSYDISIASDDYETAYIIEFFASYGEGIRRLQEGDAKGAIDIFRQVSDDLDQLSFHNNDLEKLSRSLDINVYISLAKEKLNQGDLDSANEWRGKIEKK
jgi:hypothetical protein